MIDKIFYLTDGRSIKLTASGGSPRRYRNIFGRDLFVDMDKVTKDYFEVIYEDDSEKEETEITIEEEQNDSEDYFEVIDEDDSEKEETEITIEEEQNDSDFEQADFNEEDMMIIENVLFVMSSGTIRLLDGKEIQYADVEEMLDSMNSKEVFAAIPEIVDLWLRNLGMLENNNSEEEIDQKKTSH